MALVVTLLSSPWIVAATGLAVLATFVHFYYKQKYSYWAERGIPTPPAYPYVGTSLQLFSKPLHELAKDNYRQYGRIHGLYDRHKPQLVVGEPELIRHITVKDFHVFPNRQSTDIFDETINKLLTVMTGEEWKRVRTIMTPTFTSNKMRRMFDAMNETASEAVEVLREMATSGVEVDLKDFAGKYTLDVIAKCCFATRPQSHKNPDNQFLKSAANLFNVNLWRGLLMFVFPAKLVKWLGIKVVADEPLNYFRVALKHLIKERREKNIKPNDFLQLMIEAQEEISHTEKPEVPSNDHESHHFSEHRDDQKDIEKVFNRKLLTKKTLDENELVANSCLFFAAGYETTAIVITFVIYQLAHQQDIQQKLFAVLSEAEELNYQFINTCKYLDAILQETLRMHQPGAFIVREAVEDYKLPGTDIVIPKGMTVQIPTSGIHYDPEFYSEPDQFNPDRFLPENRDKIRPYTYLPFGTGPRNCIGMRFALLEVKLAVARLTLAYKFHFTERTDFPPKFKSTPGFPKFDPLYIRFEIRE